MVGLYNSTVPSPVTSTKKGYQNPGVQLPLTPPLSPPPPPHWRTAGTEGKEAPRIQRAEAGGQPNWHSRVSPAPSLPTPHMYKAES